MPGRRLLSLLVGILFVAPLLVAQDDAGTAASPRIEIVTPGTLYYGAEFTAKERGLQPGERITWTVRRADGSPLPKEFLTRPLPGQNRCIVAGPPGDYVVTAEAFVVTLTEDIKSGDLKKGSRLPATVDRVLAQLPFTLTGDGGPRPPPPPPGPDPPPEDDLTRALRTAYAAEPDKQLVPALAEFYREAAGTAAAGTHPTWGSLFGKMQEMAARKGVAGKVQVVQKAIQAELQARLPWKGASDMELSTQGRDWAKQTFEKIAATLERLR